ncbi:MAG: hypothetical protein ABSH03_11685 [Candidatus Lustribacter sp.]|jgi:hypothetical protein
MTFLGAREAEVGSWHGIDLYVVIALADVLNGVSFLGRGFFFTSLPAAVTFAVSFDCASTAVRSG